MDNASMMSKPYLLLCPVLETPPEVHHYVNYTNALCSESGSCMHLCYRRNYQKQDHSNLSLRRQITRSKNIQTSL